MPPSPAAISANDILLYRACIVTLGLEDLYNKTPLQATFRDLERRHLRTLISRWEWFQSALPVVPANVASSWLDAGHEIRHILSLCEREYGSFHSPSENRFSAIYDRADESLTESPIILPLIAAHGAINTALMMNKAPSSLLTPTPTPNDAS